MSSGLELREQASGYRVDGEIGRFEFALYEVIDESKDVVCRAADYFPKRQPREWHKTEGFREEALCLEASQRSYRTNTAHLNRYRRQVQGGTPMRTLQDNAQKEGTRVLSFLDRHSESVLQSHGFDVQGQPPGPVVAEVKAGTDRRLSTEEVNQGLTVVCQQMEVRGFSPEQISTVETQATEAVYEDPAHCVNVAIDDVTVKKQKAQRERPRAAASEAPAPKSETPNAASKRPKVANTVARIEQGAKSFTLSGSSLGQVLRFVLAFLLDNDLLNGRIHVFTDGYKSLQQTIVRFFAWHRRVWLVLDWYHLVKKFKEDLSLACRGRAIRNGHLLPLVRFLWYGLVTEARQYLISIPTEDLKDASAIERLDNYLQRNKDSIPCYALRGQLGLRNGSSPVESANHEVTARRQKRNGMSWSKPGSHALTALSVLVCNRCQGIWVREHIVPLRFVEKQAA